MEMVNPLGSDDPRMTVGSSPRSHNPSPADLREERLKRVDEYESHGLVHSEPFEAFMTAVQADLFRAACVSEDKAKLALTGRAELGALGELEPLIKRHLLSTSRIQRNAQLEVRVRSARK